MGAYIVRHQQVDRIQMKMFNDVFNGIEALQINTNITLDKSDYPIISCFVT